MVTKIWAIVLTALTYLVLADYAVAKEQDVLSVQGTMINVDLYEQEEHVSALWDQADPVPVESVSVMSLMGSGQSTDSREFQQQVESFRK